MRTAASLLVVVGLFYPSVTSAAESDMLKEQVAADLNTYYEESAKQPFLIFDESERPQTKPPPWEQPLKQLAGADEAERKRAAAYLTALVGQAQDDEQSGAARWRATPFWGESAENPARKLRESVASELAKAKLTPDALPVLRWYLDKDLQSKNLEPVMTALGKLDGKAADELRAELAGTPHANAVVAVAALKQLTDRKGTLAAEKLAALCQHHRAGIRDAARKLNELQGGKDPGPFDAVKALRTPAVRRLLDDITPLVSDPPPAEAKFVAVTTTYFDKGGKEDGNRVTRGWLLADKGGTVEVLTPFGRRETFEKHDKPVPAGRGEGTTTCTVAVLDVKAEVERVEALRNKDDKDFALSQGGGLTGQFKGHGAGLYEILLGHWLYTTKQDELAARVLLPALDTLYQDQDLVRIARTELGEVLGYQMLGAFVGDRDYAKAEKLARRLADKFPQTRFHAYAVRLADELPQRKDDFDKLKLPTPKDWAALQAKLKRDEQIDYLCQRLRLLNCFQMGQPGGYDITETQYAEPCGISDNAAWGYRRGKTEVINPVVELMGSRERDEKAVKGLELKTADIALLAPYLKDDHYLLIVSFWRDFAADRTLHGTRGLFAGIINYLAKQDLCRSERYERMSEAERDKDIQRIVAWAKANAEKTDCQLFLQALADGVEAGERWYDIQRQAEQLVELKETKAVPLLLRYLDAKQTDDGARQRYWSVVGGWMRPRPRTRRRRI